MSKRMDIARRVLMPRSTRCVRSPVVVEGMKKPTIAMRAMITVGMTKLEK